MLQPTLFAWVGTWSTVSRQIHYSRSDAFKISFADPHFLQRARKSRVALPDLIERVSLVVTSPPYHNAISYESHQADSDANYRTRSQIDYANEYLALLDRVWTDVAMLRPGRHLQSIALDNVLDNGHQLPMSPEEIEYGNCAIGSGSGNYVRSIIWNKVTAGREAGWLSHSAQACLATGIRTS